MSFSVAVLKIDDADAPRTLDSMIEADSIAHELERRGHRVERWRVHVHQIESLVEDLAASGCALFLIEALVPRDLLRRLPERMADRPWALFGPLAATLFEESEAPFALLGASRVGAGELADRVRRTSDHSRSGSDPSRWLEGPDAVPNLIARVRSNGRSDQTGPDSPASDPAGAPAPRSLEASTLWRKWSFDSEMLPFSASAKWNYRGPALHPSFGMALLLAERGCVHGEVAFAAPPVASAGPMKKPMVEVETRDSGAELLGSWTERARARLVARQRARSCPFGICPPAAEISFDQVHFQANHHWSQGVRAFEIRAANPLPALKLLLEHFAAEDKVPERIRFQPSPRALRQCEEDLLRLCAQHPRVRFHLAGVEFFLAGRALGQPQFDTSQWEARSLARLLRRLDDHALNLDATSGHALHLFDPYTTLEEILDALQVIEEDAPFLKRAVSAERPVFLASRLAPVARRIEQDGLLTRDGAFGLGYRFASDEIPVYRDLAARGLAPLLEAIGRLRLPPAERDRLAVEGRFRWFRELARYVISRRGADRPPADGWGQVLAGVTRDLGLDQLRRR